MSVFGTEGGYLVSNIQDNSRATECSDDSEYFAVPWSEFLRIKRCAVVIPAAYCKRSELVGEGRKVSAGKALVDEHKDVPIWRISFKARDFVQQVQSVADILSTKFRATDQLEGEATLPIVTECRVGDRIYAMLLSPHLCGIIDEKMGQPKGYETDQRWDTTREFTKIVARAYGPILNRLAQLMGKNVRYYVFAPRNANPVMNRPDEIHVFSATAPPGESDGGSHAIFICGCRVKGDGTEVEVLGRTIGRGTVVKDPWVRSGEAMGQILGNTWYLLFDTYSVFNNITSAIILKRALQEMWAEARRGERGKGPGVAQLNAEEHRELRSRLGDVLPGIMLSGVQKAEDNLRKAQEVLADILEDLGRKRELWESVKASPARYRDPEIAKQEWREIRQIPGIEKVYRAEYAGVLIRTKPIMVEHGGKRYRIGQLWVRLGFGALMVTVWSDNALHPDGVTHPHVGRRGSACFGNATMAIMEAMSRFDIANAMRYVMVWLQHGYDPALAAHKIEEWPTIEEDQPC